jgi:hypothetical protein
MAALSADACANYSMALGFGKQKAALRIFLESSSHFY